MTAVELDRAEIGRLLGLLDQRMRVRGMRGSVYVVGGAAMAMTVDGSRRTLDVDVVASERGVIDEAVALAKDEGIPSTWLNENARGWVPPRLPDADTAPATLGLTVHWAPPEHLLAMKLVALRGRDAPDVVALSHQLGLGTDPGEYADLLRRVYEGEDALQQMLGVPHDRVDEEA
jgi:hypothetical protein